MIHQHYFRTAVTGKPRCEPWCWKIYLQNWLIYRLEVFPNIPAPWFAYGKGGCESPMKPIRLVVSTPLKNMKVGVIIPFPTDWENKIKNIKVMFQSPPTSHGFFFAFLWVFQIGVQWPIQRLRSKTIQLQEPPIPGRWLPFVGKALRRWLRNLKRIGVYYAYSVYSVTYMIHK